MKDYLFFNMNSHHNWIKNGILNRNFHILKNIAGREDTGKILAIDFMPFYKKRAIRIYLESILRNPGKTIYKDSKSRCFQSPDKSLEKIYFYSTIDTATDEAKLCPKLDLLIKQIGIKNPIIWSYFPVFTEYFDHFKDCIKVFDTVDNWAEHEMYGKLKDQVNQGYDTIDKQASVIFTVSPSLKKLFNNHNTHFVPNGVDYKHFRKPDKPTHPLKKIKKPIIGYHGIIQDRLDAKLLSDIAKSNQDKSFVLVGPVWNNPEINNLKKLKNIHFIGSVSYNDLPEYIHDFDACLIPHKLNEFTRSMNPLKILEYFAAGKPVISTPVAGTGEYHDLLYLGKSADELSSHLQTALSENNPELTNKRLEVAKQNSWNDRVETMLKLLSS